MHLIMWVLVAMLTGLVAEFVVKRGYGRGWDITLGLAGSLVLGWLFQSHWTAPDPSLMAATVVAAGGATGLIIAQRTVFPAAGSLARRGPGGIRPTS